MKRLTTKEFILKAKKVHGDKYDYSLTNYKNSRSKVTITCPIHGEFEQLPSNHLRGQSCMGCSIISTNIKNRDDRDIFIEKAFILYKNRYDYSMVNYKNSKTKIKIICKKHGIFEQQPNAHLTGRGCPICRESKGECHISDILTNHNIEYKRQYKFLDCKSKLPLPFDFYIPSLNMCIEYDGEQHFKSVKFWGGNNGLKTRQYNDDIKNKYCLDNDIRLIRIRYDEDIKTKLKEKLID